MKKLKYKSMFKYLGLFLACFQVLVLTAQEGRTSEFLIVKGGNAISVLIDEKDAKVVSIASGIFANDVLNITGLKPSIISKASTASSVIIAGTIGENAIIDKLIASGKLSVTAFKNDWERYAIQVIENPVKGIDKALVIAGSDRRGTAYGILELSRKIGVSPWGMVGRCYSRKKKRVKGYS
ncbi:hypothetical protein JCM19274_2604 [Algibacter lectus]|uniref:Uncharacterized protein n=1 Tax=Algibacter lectus TaxID=221126 RepID=A0A090X5Q3_9FLAO|nr:hypothetical protein [Algibacter lectus]GAL79932.1 hypothetical protein JCM19274_2604 [Algibacter lectus]